MYEEYCQYRPRDYKTFFILNSAEHEIFHDNNSQTRTVFLEENVCPPPIRPIVEKGCIYNLSFFVYVVDGGHFLKSKP